MESDRLFMDLFPQHESVDMTAIPKDFDCLRFLMDTHDTFCGRFDDYSLKYVKHFVQACESESQLIGMYA